MTAIEKNKIMPFAAKRMQAEIITLSEVREKTNITTHLWNSNLKKKWYKLTYSQNRNQHKYRYQKQI